MARSNGAGEVGAPEHFQFSGNGMLAQMVKKLAPAEYLISEFDLPDFDMTDRDMVMATLTRIQPDVIINCAAYTNVDGCESNEYLAFQVNGAAPGYLAEAAIIEK